MDISQVVLRKKNTSKMINNSYNRCSYESNANLDFSLDVEVNYMQKHFHIQSLIEKKIFIKKT